MILGVQAARNGFRISRYPSDFVSARKNQNTIPMTILNPIPNKAPRFPVVNENGIAIKVRISETVGNVILPEDRQQSVRNQNPVLLFFRHNS